MRLALAALLVTSAAAAGQDRGDDPLRKARALRSDPQLLPQARALYEKWLQEHPASEDAPGVMIELARAFGPAPEERARGLAWLRKVLERFPGTPYEREALDALQQVAGWAFSGVRLLTAPPGEPGLIAARPGGPPSRFELFRCPPAEFLARLETAPLEDFDPEVPAERWIRLGETTKDFPHGLHAEKRLNFDLGAPGRYRLEETIDGLRRSHFVRVATFDVFVRALGGRAVAFVHEVPGGRPLEGVSVRMRRASGTDLVRSGPDGLAWFDLAPGETGVVVAAREGEAQYCEISYDAPLKDALVYITTDRPVYRPGQEVHWKALLRDRSDDRLLIRAGARSRAEIRDPDGRVLHSGEHAWNEHGSISGSFRLGDEPPLGEYRVVVREKRTRPWRGFLDGEEEEPWSKAFRVAAYRKPDARVTVDFADLRPVAGAKVKARIRAEYFFGGPVAGADVSWQVVSPYEDNKPSGPKPPFEDPNAWFYAPVRDEDAAWWEPDPDAGDEVADGEGKTGPDGTLEIEFPTHEAPVMRRYVVLATVTDESRRGSSGKARITVAPSSLLLSTGVPRLFYAPGDRAQARVRVTDLDGRSKADQEVEFAAFLGEDREDGAEFESFFTARGRTDAAGHASFGFAIERAGKIRIRARARDELGRAVEDRADFWSAGEGMPGKETDDLEVLPDRVVYEPGDTIRLLVRSPRKPLQALLTVEGGSLQQARVVELRRLNEVLELPARAAHAPNVFVKLVAWKDGTVLAGGFEVLVLPRERFLDVEVKTDRPSYGPRSKARVSVAVTSRGEPAPGEVELAVIDESILFVRPDATPDIRLFFARRRDDSGACAASGNFADNWDSFGPTGRLRGGRGMLTGATFGLAEAAAVPEEAAFAHAETRRFFPDTLHWAAQLRTGPDGRAVAEIETPDSLTTWRIVARAVSGAERTGSGVSSMPTRKDVQVRLSAPRFYTERDSGTVSTLVHNDLPEEAEFTVRLAVLGGEGGGERKLRVPSKGVRREDWAVRAPRAGTMKLRAEALSRAESDALEIEVPVKPHGHERFEAKSGAVSGSWAAELVLPADAPPANALLEITVTAGTMPAVLEALPFLAGYPYGCVEQTMSRFLPTVTAAAALRRTGIPNPALEKSLPDMVSKGLQRLYGFQHEDGGWGWWKRDATHPFMTAYALFGLVSARRAGFEVDGPTVERGLDALQAMDLTPFSLHVLSLAGRNVKEELGLFPAPADPEGLAYLALAGRRDLLPRLPAPEGAAGPDAVRTWGLLLRALASAAPEDPRIPRLVERLLGSRRGHAWYSTLDSAWAVFGLAEAAAGEREPEALRVTLDDREIAVRPGRVRVEGKDLQPGPNRVQVTERGGTRVFASALLRHMTGEENLAAQQGAVKVGRVFERRDVNDRGEAEWRRLRSGEAVRSGEQIRVQVTVSGGPGADYLMVESPLAAGTEPWEPPADEFDWADSWFGRRELRDDRVAVAGASLWRDWNTFEFILVPTLPGEYHVLPAVAFAMYDPDRRGSSDEFLLRVADR